MQGNDISAFTDSRQGTMFEGVLANPPAGRSFRILKEKISVSDSEEMWADRLTRWIPSTFPLKSLSDQVNRLGVMTEVYTFLSPNAVDPIGKWLIRKGVSVPVYYFESVAELAYDLSFNRSIVRIMTASPDDAQVLGLRSTVVSADKAWAI